MTFKLVICIFLLYTVSLVGITQIDTVLHENAHEQIMLQHGCHNVSVQINFDGSGMTKCNDLGYKYSAEERNQHLLNEIIGYNVNVIYIAILTGFLFLSLAIVFALRLYSRRN